MGGQQRAQAAPAIDTRHFPPPRSSDDWRSGGLTASVLATLEDFLQVGGRYAQGVRGWTGWQGWTCCRSHSLWHSNSG